MNLSNIFSGTSTATTAKEDKNGTVMNVQAVIRMLEKTIPETPLFYASELIDPDACYKMRPQQLSFYSMANCFDKNTKLVYVCGTNVRDALVQRGVAFVNYKPEPDKEN